MDQPDRPESWEDARDSWSNALYSCELLREKIADLKLELKEAEEKEHEKRQDLEQEELKLQKFRKEQQERSRQK